MNDQPKPAGELVARITDYLGAGGLFNPELMEHDKVRDLLMDCRDALTQPKPATGHIHKFASAYGKCECGVTVDQFIHQPNPATGEHYNSELADVMLNEGDFEGLANEVGKPNKPATGEWTVGKVQKLLGTEVGDLNLQRVADAHNAALQTLMDALKNIVEEGHPEQWEVMVANAAMAKLEKK